MRVRVRFTAAPRNTPARARDRSTRLLVFLGLDMYNSSVSGERVAQLIVLVVRKDLLVLSWQHDGGSDMAVLLVQYVECANGVPLHGTASESE